MVSLLQELGLQCGKRFVPSGDKSPRIACRCGVPPTSNQLSNRRAIRKANILWPIHLTHNAGFWYFKYRLNSRSGLPSAKLGRKTRLSKFIRNSALLSFTHSSIVETSLSGPIVDVVTYLPVLVMAFASSLYTCQIPEQKHHNLCDLRTKKKTHDLSKIGGWCCHRGNNVIPPPFGLFSSAPWWFKGVLWHFIMMTLPMMLSRHR